MARRYTIPNSNPGNSIVGFLDINFGVLGIFIVVFAVQLLLSPQPAGQLPDLFVTFEPHESSGQFTAVFHHPDRDDVVTAETKSGFVKALEVALTETSRTLGEPLEITALISPEVVDVEWRLSVAAKRLGESGGENFAAVAVNKRPVTDSAQADEILAKWRTSVEPDHGS